MHFLETLLTVFVLAFPSVIFEGASATKISGINDEPTGSWNLTATDSVRRALLPGYDRWVRPAEGNEITPVKFSLTANHMYIDEAKSTATLIGWMKITWHDNKLRWNSSEYSDVDLIRVSSDEVWKPDLELYNVASKPGFVGTQASILLYADGTVLWVPQVKFEVYCRLELKSWPRDTQTCRFVVGSWTHHSLIMDLSFDGPGFESIETSGDSSIEKWKVKGFKVERLVQFYNCCAEPYTSLQYDITIERRGNTHALINEAPVLGLAILLIAAALREPKSRGLLLVTVIVVSAIYLVALTMQFPNFGGSPPRIAVLYCGLLILAALWGVTSAVADCLSNSTSKSVPGALKRFVKKSKLNIAVEEDGVAMSMEPESVAKNEMAVNDSWGELSKLFDRVFLAVGVLCFVLLAVLSY